MAKSKLFLIFSVFNIIFVFTCTFSHQYSTEIYKFLDPHKVKEAEKVQHQTVHPEEGSNHLVVNGYEIVFRVVNGQPVELGEIPYQIALMTRIPKGRKKGLYSAFCGGSIIGPSKILTAAHCVERKRLFDCGKGRLKWSDFRNDRVVAGQLKTTTIFGSEGQWRKIKSGKYPAKFNFPRNDIAVLYLMNAFNFNNNVQPIAYASKSIDYHQECLVSGYGMISNNMSSKILLKASLQLLSKKKCKQIHKGRGYRTDDLICISDLTANVHLGDSGGPLVCKGTGDPAEQDPRGILTGVVSEVKYVTDEVKSLRRVGIINGEGIVFRVVNGERAKVGEFPYQIALMKRMRKTNKLRKSTGKKYYANCGGTIIGPKKVLSAAHCFRSVNTNKEKSGFSNCGNTQRAFTIPSSAFQRKMVVAAGQLYKYANYGAEGQWRQINNVKYPQTYSGSRDDIAVVQINNAFKFNDAVSWVPYASKNKDYNQHCTLSGYGRINKLERSEHLLKADLRLLSKLKCIALVKNKHRLHAHKLICTSDEVSDTAKGDSGGPLVCKGTGDPAEGDKGIVVGIVQGKVSSSIRGQRRTVFTRVSSFYKFINFASRFKTSNLFIGVIFVKLIY
ncbi:hypothetical protein O0L34_g5893 [Tuta absoluta]|nr:hypothetical protein O0L34_g5893 [Tuta absoluta]